MSEKDPDVNMAGFCGRKRHGVERRLIEVRSHGITGISYQDEFRLMSQMHAVRLIPSRSAWTETL